MEFLNIIYYKNFVFELTDSQVSSVYVSLKFWNCAQAIVFDYKGGLHVTFEIERNKQTYYCEFWGCSVFLVFIGCMKQNDILCLLEMFVFPVYINID